MFNCRLTIKLSSCHELKICLSVCLPRLIIFVVWMTSLKHSWHSLLRASSIWQTCRSSLAGETDFWSCFVVCFNVCCSADCMKTSFEFVATRWIIGALLYRRCSFFWEECNEYLTAWVINNCLEEANESARNGQIVMHPFFFLVILYFKFKKFMHNVHGEKARERPRGEEIITWIAWLHGMIASGA